jgi:hypothetical protein
MNLTHVSEADMHETATLVGFSDKPACLQGH